MIRAFHWLLSPTTIAKCKCAEAKRGCAERDHSPNACAWTLSEFLDVVCKASRTCSPAAAFQKVVNINSHISGRNTYVSDDVFVTPRSWATPPECVGMFAFYWN